MTAAVRTIVQVNTRDRRGGAEQVALNLHRAYRRRGLDAYLAVGDRLGDEAGVRTVSMGAGRSSAYRAWRAFADRAGGVARAADALRGIEPFHHPATYRLPGLAPRAPDLIHAHNLHGGYFDLRALPWLAERAPLALTLHDAWLLSGHCAHSFECGRWRTGCGECPDLSIYPAVRRDRTAFNWRRKRGIYARTRLFVATPCEWLMRRVGESMLDGAILDRRVIPNGVDLSVFRPGDMSVARAALGIAPDARVLLFVASGARDNPFKDYATVRAAVGRVAASLRQEAADLDTAAAAAPVLFIALGGAARPETPERMDGVELRLAPFEDDAATTARYYQAADVYIHAARADTFPNAVLEALACGTPVVATAVGGIPEQIRGLGSDRDRSADSGSASEAYGPEEATGVLVGAGDAAALAGSALRLLRDPELRRRLAANATRDAARRFDVERQADAYLDWYASIARRWRAGCVAS